MTTAHRPTWHPVAGGKDQGGNRVLVSSRQYSSKDLPGHTLIKYRKNGQGDAEEVKNINYKEELLKKENEYLQIKKGEEPENEIEDEEEEEQEESDENSSDSDFSEEELRKEIEIIKMERAQTEKLEKEKEKKNETNPLDAGFSLKRKWTEETIFRNQSRDEPKEIQSFVNDTVRSDFHRKVLRKYIL